MRSVVVPGGKKATYLPVPSSRKTNARWSIKYGPEFGGFTFSN
jgi:hypothetical protein